VLKVTRIIVSELSKRADLEEQRAILHTTGRAADDWQLRRAFNSNVLIVPTIKLIADEANVQLL